MIKSAKKGSALLKRLAKFTRFRANGPYFRVMKMYVDPIVSRERGADDNRSELQYLWMTFRLSWGRRELFTGARYERAIVTR
ncbi:MAG TPA: hypothetical protein VEP90_25640 [Methylomirabilota bacterium]|nr:hypothetical protein [Methylomirabilota bacterium]